MGNRIFKISNFRKTVSYLRKNGVCHAYYAARERIEEERRSDYIYMEPSAGVLEAQRMETADYPEMFSIVVPAYETEEKFLREMIDSVRRQSYCRWELIIVDAGSSDIVERTVREIAEETADDRIKYNRLTENKGISDNTNAGIAQASGDYIALLDHDDFLAPDALYYMAVEIHRIRQRGMAPVLLYTDEDKYDDNDSYYTRPNNKEKFNLDLILSNNYICHFMAVEAETMKNLGLRGKFDGAQDYDLVLRVVGMLCETTRQNMMHTRIIHIPHILYHWRCHSGSTADNTASKRYAYEAGKAALEDFCNQRGWNVKIDHSLHLGFYEITYLPDIMAVREDVGIVGGRILDARGRICSGAMDNAGVCLYQGLHKEYSGGSTHRAALKQDVAAVDIRCIRVRPELWEEFAHITGIAYEEKLLRCKTGGVIREMRIADVSRLTCDEAGYRKLSIEFGKAAAKRGYLVLWNPAMVVQR